LHLGCSHHRPTSGDLTVYQLAPIEYPLPHYLPEVVVAKHLMDQRCLDSATSKRTSKLPKGGSTREQMRTMPRIRHHRPVPLSLQPGNTHGKTLTAVTTPWKVQQLLRDPHGKRCGRLTGHAQRLNGPCPFRRLQKTLGLALGRELTRKSPTTSGVRCVPEMHRGASSTCTRRSSKILRGAKHQGRPRFTSHKQKSKRRMAT